MLCSANIVTGAIFIHGKVFESGNFIYASGVQNLVQFEFQLRHKDEVEKAETLKDPQQTSSENTTSFDKIYITKR